MLAGKLYKLAVDLPSSRNSGLDESVYTLVAGWQRKRTKAAPDFAIAVVKLQYRLQVFDGLWKIFLCPQNRRDLIHRGDGVRVVAQSLFVAGDCLIELTHQLQNVAYRLSVKTNV